MPRLSRKKNYQASIVLPTHVLHVLRVICVDKFRLQQPAYLRKSVRQQKYAVISKLNRPTVKPRPESQSRMDMILFEVFLKNIHLIPQDQMVH